MIQAAIKKIIDHQNLAENEAIEVMNFIMGGEATPAQIGSFITGLRMKGETIEEITGFAKAMRAHALGIKSKRSPLVDTCGTGGDKLDTFNISTISAFVVAGAGLAVAKHGNRSVSSKCGSADLLEALGIKIDLPPDKVERCLDELGFGFMFAPVFHPAMKYATPPRREIGIRTVFNILGPLTNPAGAQAQVLGVYDPALTEPLAQVLYNLGSQAAFVVHGLDGLDEISTIGATKITELKAGNIKTYEICPEDFGLNRAVLADIAGGTIEDNVELTLAVLGGKEGPARDIVLLNAAAALVAGGKAGDFIGGMEIAAESIDSGAALAKLEGLREYSTRFEVS